MFNEIPIINPTSELSGCRGAWSFDGQRRVWCLEDILYTQAAATPKFQRMSVFVPEPYLRGDGGVNPDGRCGRYTAKTAPIIFANNAAGYMQMPHTWLGGPRDVSAPYLERGMVFVTCGCRGRESRDAEGKLCGKAPWTLIDFKTAIRFLRHNRDVLPGDFDRIISVGWSAGGAMSSLIGLTGDNEKYLPYLDENGAFLDESDAVFAAQIYCPIIDLEHADLAYEWQFHADKENEDSPAGPHGVMTAFEDALSAKLSEKYIRYFNGLGLKDPDTGELLAIGEDGRSGTGYEYLMKLLGDSAAEYLRRLENGELNVPFTAKDYLEGNYSMKVEAGIAEGRAEGAEDAAAGAEQQKRPEAATKQLPGGAADGVPDAAHVGGAPDMAHADAEPDAAPPSLGDLLSRPPKGVPFHEMRPPMIDVPGTDKRSWLTWEDGRAAISDLDTYVLAHRRRMKPCTSFDTLGMNSGENQEFGTEENDYLHFCPEVAEAIASLKDEFPEEYARYYPAWETAAGDKEQMYRKYLLNPMNFVGEPGTAGDAAGSGAAEICSRAKHFRIRVGACDADTSFMISMALAVKLANAGYPVDYALVWDQPHCEADYPGEFCSWIESIAP